MGCVLATYWNEVTYAYLYACKELETDTKFLTGSQVSHPRPAVTDTKPTP